ncbi:MAG: hypothetical protein CMD16_04820 [Flavobacteriales bacterium]|nr:hypothetical protein [Flavobacteriales bacterium]|tara:strand:+ start:4960 stop:6936 length:1977 start_codon:yes stop_codon:yes gene_type:complete
MKHFILTPLIFIFSCNLLTAQQISSDSFNKDFIHEDFNQEGEYFKIVTTTDNYFILDKGDYLLSRNSNESEYAIIANNSLASDFILKTSLRLGPSENKKSSIGIILKAQQDGKGAIIFEINKKGEYRIKQLIGNSYQALSGKSKDEGWVKSKLINGIDEHNFIEIRSEKNIYDIYTNSEYLTTFFVPDLISGSFGLIISAGTKARVAYYYLNIKGAKEITADYTNKDNESVNSNIEDLNRKIQILEENNLKLNEIKSGTKALQSEEITKLKAANTKLENTIIEVEEDNIELNKENATIKSQKALQSEELTKLKVVSSELKNTIAEIEEKNIELNKQNTNITSEINQLKDKLSKAKLNNSELASVSVQQEKEINSLNNTVKVLKESSSDATDKNKKLQKKINSLKGNITLEKAINTELENDLNKVNTKHKNKIAKLTKKVSSLKTEVNSLKTEVSKLETTNSSLATDLSKNKKKHQETKKGLSASVKNKKAEINELSSEIKTLRSTQSKHNKVTSDLNEQIAQMKNKINDLENQNNLLNTEFSVMSKTNTELKELFIQKDFEVNGVKPSDMMVKTSNTPPAPIVLKGSETIYTVQFGVFMQEQSYQSTKQLDAVWYNTTEQGTYVYYSGEFNSPQEAASHQNNLIAKGYNNAFVVTLTK